MKRIIGISLLLFLAGCGGAIQQSWMNFRAHYNAYYNAEKSFKAGLAKLSEQPKPELNDPIRVHPELPAAGSADFEKAIDKGAGILVKFPNSKWADNSLFILGRSYYYLKEFYQAREKFEELYDVTEDSVLKQKAVIWKARTLLDLQQYSEGISFIERKLVELNSLWSSTFRAEAVVLLAEHHVMLDNWEMAARHLGNTVSKLPVGSLRGRTFFLMGQVYERLARFGEAFFAYDNVAPNFPDYEYIYRAELNKGRMARKEGNFNRALSIYKSMKNDDKNYERISEINYQIARTKEARGSHTEAESLYKQLLASKKFTPSHQVQAQSYFRLGKIYSEHYDNYGIAAAYFDSSATLNSAAGRQHNNEDIEVLASAYGKYSSLKTEEARIDSLIELGSLSPQELDSVLQKVREMKVEELIEKREKGRSQEKVLTNIGREESRRESSSDFGFLNYKNPQLLLEAQREFKAVWGNPPLVDNWRRSAAIDGSNIARGPEEEEEVAERAVVENLNDRDLGINLEEIPRTEKERKDLYRRLARIQYEMGSVLFLNLGMADSSRVYFRRVAEMQTDDGLAAKAMYALFELNNILDAHDEAAFWSNRILKEYPATVYADRVRKRVKMKKVGDSGSDSTASLLAQVEQIEHLPDSVSKIQKAEMYRSLAMDNRSDKLAPYIHYRALNEYLLLAKSRLADPHNAKTDTAIAGRDTMSSNTLNGIFGIGQPVPSGSYWDSVRVLVLEYKSSFDNQPHSKQLDTLESILKKPDTDSKISTCKELGIELKVKPGMGSFLDKVILPETVRKESLPDSVVYRLIVSREGTVQYYEPAFSDIEQGLRAALDEAISENLLFHQLPAELKVEKVQCNVSFPIGY